LNRNVFDSEVDASLYPLPSLFYTLTKNILSRHPELYRTTPSLLSSTLTILIMHVLAQTVRAPDQVTTQNKYLALAAKLLTNVRVALNQDEQWPKEALTEVVGCKVLRAIEDGVEKKLKGSKRHEQCRLLREVVHEWYNIRHSY
jgi:hypothetical protein